MATRLRVLVVDDTALYRKILGDAVNQLPEAELAGAAHSGPTALKRLTQGDIDLVLLDVVMPEMDGVQTLAHIRRDWPHVAVVLVSGVTGRDADVTVAALANGALDFIPKPQAASFSEAMQRLVADLRHVLQVVAIRRLSSGACPPQAPPLSPAATRPATPPLVPVPPAAPSAARASTRPFTNMSSPPAVSLILIGVSTGGPRALQEVIPSLPAGLAVPILIVQHMPALFTKSLAEQLSRTSRLPVSEATHGEPILPGRVLVAPGGRHLTVRLNDDGKSLRTELTDTPPVHSCRPSVDVLFESVARSGFGGGIAALILTGMGEDGAQGVSALKARGRTWCIAQDQASCVVYGMPEAIVRRQLADEILPLPAIGPRLSSLPLNRLA